MLVSPCFSCITMNRGKWWKSRKRFPDVQVEGLIHPTASLDLAHCKEVVDKIVRSWGRYRRFVALFFRSRSAPLFETMAGGDISPEEALERTMNSVAYAASTKATVGILLPDPMRMELSYTKHIIRNLVDAGAQILRLDDVVGQGIYSGLQVSVHRVDQ